MRKKKKQERCDFCKGFYSIDRIIPHRQKLACIDCAKKPLKIRIKNDDEYKRKLALHFKSK